MEMLSGMKHCWNKTSIKLDSFSTAWVIYVDMPVWTTYALKTKSTLKHILLESKNLKYYTFILLLILFAKWLYLIYVNYTEQFILIFCAACWIFKLSRYLYHGRCCFRFVLHYNNNSQSLLWIRVKCTNERF